MDPDPPSQTASCPLPEQQVEEAVRALLKGRALRLSERNRRFLAFVVNETLSGRSERIKAYAIGVDVFGCQKALEWDPGSACNWDPFASWVRCG